LIDRAFATLALLVVLFRFFDAAVFLRATLTGLFAAPRARTEVPPAELLRFRFGSFNVSFFNFSRIALRAARTLDAGLFLPTRFRVPDDDACFATRFVVDFARDADSTFFVRDFVVFFDLLRATMLDSPRARVRARALINHALTATAHQKMACGLCVNESVETWRLSAP
jgi:hypothetical protein